MSLQHLDNSPKADDFTPLSEHEQQTPASFFGAKPVLHAHYEAMTLAVAAGQLQQDDAFRKFNSRREEEEDLVDGVDVWVSSESVSFLILDCAWVLINATEISSCSKIHPLLSAYPFHTHLSHCTQR